MEENVVEVNPENARKKKKAPETWKRAKAKVERYSAKMPPGFEKEIKRLETIIKPVEYIEVFKKYGTVVLLNNVKDWKTALGNIIRPPGNWHFQFNQCKRFFLRRNKSNDVYVRGEPNYSADIGSYKSVLKRGKTFNDVSPDLIEKYKVVVKKDKLKDVDALLKKHFGQNWKSRDDLDFYKQVLNATSRNRN